MVEIYTIGHSNRSILEFLGLLRRYGIEVLADVRRFPTSKYEHFGQDVLSEILRESGIEYVWFERLGGYRKKILDRSPNIAIKSEGFRNYADYMMTEEFKAEIRKLVEIAERKRLCVMCAERFFWRCHRRFISDYLTFLGHSVYHIMDDGLRRHRLSKEARIAGDVLVYDVVP